MEKLPKFISSLLIVMMLFLSCASTSEITEKENQNIVENVSESPKREIVVTETPEEKFLKSLEGISIQKVSSPKEILLGRNFSGPFVFSVTNADGTAAEGFNLTLSYPASKTDGAINFEKTTLTTDSEGKISFTADKPAFAVNTNVSVFPTPVSEDPELAEKLSAFTAQAAWKVKSDVALKGAVLFIWDFNEKDRPVNNSYNIQAEFRSRGITMVGNGPVNETSYIGKSAALYKDTYEIIGGSQYGYLIYGTIKFEQPVTALEDGSGYTCILKADIEAVRMKNGEKVYSSSITYQANGKNWNECVSVGKDKLSELVVDDIVYGL